MKTPYYTLWENASFLIFCWKRYRLDTMEGRNRKLNRWQGYDYSQSGLYFVTICTKYKIASQRLVGLWPKWFGDIKNGKMVLNEYGKIVQMQWQWLGQQYSYIELDIFQIMPNHVHAVIGINVGTGYADVGTGRDLSLRKRGRNAPQLKIKSLSELIGAFKTTSSKLIHAHNLPKFAWQRSFHDRVIRNDDELNRIRVYIANNPANWESDYNNPRK